MSNEIRSPEGVVQCMDAYTVVQLDKENVIVALPNMVGASDTEYAGSLLFSKNYILDLIANAIEHDVLTRDDVKNHLLSSGMAQYHRECAESIDLPDDKE